MKIGLVHATLNAVQPMIEAFRQYDPGVAVLNFLDEGLLQAVNEQGGVTPKILRRFVSLLSKAEESGVDGILLSCSAFSPNVSSLSPLFSIPIVSVDGAMLSEAVELGSRIGVIATVTTSGPTTARQIRELAVEKGKQVEVEVVISTEAFSELQAGNLNSHDALIKAKAEQLAGRVDVIVLAQISTARAAEIINLGAVPILTSPKSSITAIMTQLRK